MECPDGVKEMNRELSSLEADHCCGLRGLELT